MEKQSKRCEKPLWSDYLIEQYENKPEVTSVELWQDCGTWHALMWTAAGRATSGQSSDLETALSLTYARTCQKYPEWMEEKETQDRAAVAWLKRVRDITKDQRVENAQVKTSKRGTFKARMRMGSIVGKGPKYVPTVDEAIKQAHADCVETISQMRNTLADLGELAGDC